MRLLKLSKTNFIIFKFLIMSKTWDEETEEFEKSMTQGYSIPGVDWDKHPFFVEKLRRANEFFRKNPPPGATLRGKKLNED